MKIKEKKPTEKDVRNTANKEKIPIFKICKNPNKQKESQINTSLNIVKPVENLNSLNQKEFIQLQFNPETPLLNPEYDNTNQVLIHEKIQELPIPRKTQTEYLNLSSLNSNFDLSKSKFKK